MTTTETFEILCEASVPAYLASRSELAPLIDACSVVACEVGDGNLNLVFVCRDAHGRSLVVKQALPYVRAVGPSWPLTADRAHAEARGLAAAVAASPSTAARLLAYDAERRVLAMEDLSALVVWRGALLDGAVTADAPAQCGRHVARLWGATGPLFRAPGEVRVAMAASANPAMCGITEDLVFSEPYVEHVHNRFAAEVRDLVLALRADAQVLDEVARLKVELLTRTDALVHGDLHTGSVMVGTGDDARVRVIDAEFCFYGPVAFDLGTLLANLLFAAVRADALDRPAQAVWLAAAPAALWRAFHDEVRVLWPARADRSLTDATLDAALRRISGDAIGFAACEVVRRVVGFAKVADLETLPAVAHAEAAGRALAIAHRWLVAPPIDGLRGLGASGAPFGTAHDVHAPGPAAPGTVLHARTHDDAA